MTSRPIIFSAPMIRALLAGDKTQTRRIVKPQPPADCSRIVVSKYHPIAYDKDGIEGPGDPIYGAYSEDGEWGVRCPHGQPGDLLWVRESFLVQPDLWGNDHGPQPVHYAADIGQRQEVEDYIGKPSIHMPRWASRLTLRITDVRVQRLQEISEDDALEEGITYNQIPNNGLDPMRARTWFRGLWSSTHGPDSWSANPYVWALTFDVIRKNVDEVKA